MRGPCGQGMRGSGIEQNLEGEAVESIWKAPEDWRTPRRFAKVVAVGVAPAWSAAVLCAFQKGGVHKALRATHSRRFAKVVAVERAPAFGDG